MASKEDANNGLNQAQKDLNRIERVLSFTKINPKTEDEEDEAKSCHEIRRDAHNLTYPRLSYVLGEVVLALICNPIVFPDMHSFRIFDAYGQVVNHLQDLDPRNDPPSIGGAPVQALAQAPVQAQAQAQAH